MQFDFPFEELGLPLPDGFEAGSFSGVATIACDLTRAWRVAGIKVDAAKLVEGSWVHKPVTPPPAIARLIAAELLTQSRWRKRIKDKVDEALAANDEVEDSAFKRAYAREVQV